MSYRNFGRAWRIAASSLLLLLLAATPSRLAAFPLQEPPAPAASEDPEALLAVARAAGTSGDQEAWTRALLGAVQLRLQRDGYEAGLRSLEAEPWPSAPEYRAVLHLFRAHTLYQYYWSRSWEINLRERVDSAGTVGLDRWTRDQIAAAVMAGYLEVWQDRAALGGVPVDRLAEFFRPGSYPPEVRGTLRDAVTYMLAELLSNPHLWTPRQDHDAARLDLARLSAGGGSLPAMAATVERLADPAVHPLEKIAAVLGDLEAWHLSERLDERLDEKGGRNRAAALEARRELVLRLHTSTSRKAAKAAIRQGFEDRLAADRDLPWWSMGMATLSDLLLQEETVDPEARARAHAVAFQGWQAHPDSPGGVRCLRAVRLIENPDFDIAAMTSDGLARRSLQVTHSNLPALYFRAYRGELPLSEYDDDEELPSLLAREPAVAWTVELPPTPDFREHTTYVTPPLDRPGLYRILASTGEGFDPATSRIDLVRLIVGDLVLVSRFREPFGGRDLEVLALSGTDGRPLPGTRVQLLGEGDDVEYEPRGAGTAGQDGAVRLRLLLEESVALLGRSGKDVAWSPDFEGWEEGEVPADSVWAFVYTDRAVYRPGQKILWKVLAYGGDYETGRFQAHPRTEVEVTLVDARGEVVSRVTARTGDFGTASGELAIPAGRPLGVWQIFCGDDTSGTPVQVEEYKRPTFEVTLNDPAGVAGMAEPLRLGRPAVLTGTARYYSGLPVTAGKVRWEVEREEVSPWWWWRPAKPAEPAASGVAELRQDGTFQIELTPADPLAEETAREPGEENTTWRFRVTAEVTDEGGETREAERGYRIGRTTVEALIAPEAGFLRAGKPAAVTLTRADLDGRARPGEGTWTLLELRQPAAVALPADLPPPPHEDDYGDPRAAGGYSTPGDALSPRWRRDFTGLEPALARWADGRQVGSGTVRHGADGVARLTLPADLAPGAYRLRYETADEGGPGDAGRYRTFRDLIVAGTAGPAGRRTPLALPAVLRAETQSVPVGGTARLFVHSGLPGQTMYLEIYHAGRLTERRLLRSDTAASASSIVELPVRRQDRGGFAVRLLVLRDHQLFDLKATVQVPWDDRKLDVELASFRDPVRPGGRETWRVTVKGPSGGSRPAAGLAAEVLASMYDRSLDLFAPYEPPNPLLLYPDRATLPPYRTSLGEEEADTLTDQAAWRPELPPPSPALSPSWLQFPRLAVSPVQPREMPEGAVAEAIVVEDSSPLAIPPPELNPVPEPPKPAPPPPPVLRSDFAETAFWFPHLLTGPDGAATLEFTVPDSVTSWAVWVHAVTADLRSGSVRREVRSARDLMVRPYLPRFLREGDHAELRVGVDNASAAPLSGEVAFDLLDPETGASRLADFGLAAGAVRPFTAAPGAGTSVAFPVTVPRGVGPVHVRVTATAGALSDGELRPLPVLPSRLRLTQSRFAAVRDGESRTLRFEDLEKGADPTLETEQLVVTVDGQLFYGVLEALPYLADYPFECTEQTLNRFLSTGIVSSLFGRYPAVARMAGELAKRETAYETWDQVDPNRKTALEETPWLGLSQGGPKSEGADPGLIKVLDPRIAEAERKVALEKLAKAQLADGAFPWWPGGSASPGMTLYLLHGFAKAVEHGVDVPKPLVQQAWSYLGRHYASEHASKLGKEQEGCCWDFLTFLNYVATAFPDTSWTGEALPAAEQDRILGASFRRWREHPPYLRAMLALTLKRRGRVDDARAVFAGLMEASRTTPEEGTFWPAQAQPWLWYHDSVEGHAFILRALMEIAPEDPRRHGLVQWLFLNKKLNHWKSTRATAEALHALVHYLDEEGQLGGRETVQVRVGTREESFVFEPDRYTGKKNQVVVEGGDLDPARSAVTVVPETPGLLFASATWHFSTEELPEAGSGDLFAVSRRYFRRVREGEEMTLQPLAEGAVLQPGDEVEVQLVLTSRAPAEYVHLRDPRPAGFEPGAARSGFRWGQGLAYYEETRDSGTNFFVERLPAGEYTLRYRVRANVAGIFRSGPATLQSMYAPEFTAYSAGEVVRVQAP